MGKARRQDRPEAYGRLDGAVHSSLDDDREDGLEEGLGLGLVRGGGQSDDQLPQTVGRSLGCHSDGLLEVICDKKSEITVP